MVVLQELHNGLYFCQMENTEVFDQAEPIPGPSTEIFGALAKELALPHIRVNCVAPGVIDTGMNSILGEDTLEELRQTTPLGRIGAPEDAAEAICFLAESRFITGQVLSPNGGFYTG